MIEVSIQKNPFGRGPFDLQPEQVLHKYGSGWCIWNEMEKWLNDNVGEDNYSYIILLDRYDNYFKCWFPAGYAILFENNYYAIKFKFVWG